MKRSAILRDVPHIELEKCLGNQLEVGWVVRTIVPSSTHVINMPGSSFHIQVTHWTLVLETELDNLPPPQESTYG